MVNGPTDKLTTTAENRLGYFRFTIYYASTSPAFRGQRRNTSHSQIFRRRNGNAMTDADNQSAGEAVEPTMNELVADYEARMDEVAELITRVRHEINNPLTGVLGQAQLLLREDLNESARKRAQTIEELAMRMRDIVAQLREIQRPPKATPLTSKP